MPGYSRYRASALKIFLYDLRQGISNLMPFLMEVFTGVLLFAVILVLLPILSTIMR